ncbi:pyridine nucleotide-disulfide oxidoreductase [Mesorhizobium sp. M9A.F.Ca.ET.002.03.1.2]|uniref:NAD(P)-binding domain-containing protein n=1 Tax=Mesorhizobium sp. M9A.F.Ca.ET.002.03.1.2 TaxID=2493668 RepID=UPI000F756B0A|nr:NAD(P)-binding domain-containing protein [Mesorhizobium sp. M9A.F.Ca.ET.002.03.1.2]AZN98814.1 pyridine nucleotide-disulfide oxidoreductase [Mesorhizobium sp. M9A.F.Ca.ET.002.03.1.2]
MQRTDVAVIGAGQAGLAVSRCLSERGIGHVVLERGRVAERWRSERWDSLRLLTPNWMTRLPGGGYRGPDPDGFMTMPETVRFFEEYGRSIGAPVESGAEVRSAEAIDGGFRLFTNRARWTARAIVVATGYSDRPCVPPIARHISPSIRQITPWDYRNPGQLPPGGVLVVGASATGMQLAEEIHRSGRPVTLSVGGHTRLPRLYRGQDILWWLDRLGTLDRPIGELPDPAAARRQSSLQLIGTPERRSLDLAHLCDQDVRLVGRAVAAYDRRVRFDGNLGAATAAAEYRLRRVLANIDRAAALHGDGRSDEPQSVQALILNVDPVEIDLIDQGIRTVIWATGYHREYPWLKMPVFDAQGEILNDGGICPLPGLYVLGLNFMRRRNSSFIDGVGRDAEALADHIAGFVGALPRIAA